MSGNLLSLLFQTGFYFAILAGYLGDRRERRRPGGRAMLAMIATLAAIPFQIALFFIPLHGFFLPEGGGVVSVTIYTLLNIVTNPWVGAAFIVALIAVAFSSADIPNRNALLTGVNLPEHRGTAVGMLTIAIGIGVALGNALTGVLFNFFAQYLESPLYFAVGLALFQLVFIPAGLSFYRLAKTSPQDTAEVQHTLTERAKQL
jgi:MFS family permease